MPAKVESTQVRTRLAAVRVKRGVTQREMARLTGIPPSTYRRLERGRHPNPPIRYLTNCAIVLGCDLGEILEGDWTEWTPFASGSEFPPDRGWYASIRARERRGSA